MSQLADNNDKPSGGRLSRGIATAGRRLALTLAALVLLATAVEVAAHNLQTKMVYMFFDPDTQACMDARFDGATPLPPGCNPLPSGWQPGDSPLQANDEIGLIIKVVPRDGTTTGVGGHIDFYVPNGVQVTDVAYLLPGDSDPNDGITGYDKVPMKGQSLIAIGAGPVGAKATPELIGLIGPYTNLLGVTEDPVVSGSGLHRGTIAGVYGDTGIFFSTDPDTAYGSWQRFTGDAGPDDLPICGLAGTALTAGKTITNNSGDVFIPCNKWDAEQMFAWGAKGTTYAGAGLRGGLAIADYPDQRGNAPWGFGSGVAGPQSGYAWNFDWDAYIAAGGTPTNATHVQAAMGPDKIGPWQRIKYPGSRIALDQPGLASSVLGIASTDGGTVGFAPNALPETVSQFDNVSPKAIRWAVGQLTSLVPEYAWVKFKVTDPSKMLGVDGCPRFHGDTFGGDAGGTDNGKDHLWRYYEPSRVTANACLLAGKPTDLPAVKVGEVFQYKLKTYNLGSTPLTNVVIRDTLPSGVSFVSAFPAQDSGPNPLVWNIGTLLPGERFESLLTVKATGTGALDNRYCVTSDQFPTPECTTETVPSGSFPILRQAKSVTPTTAVPGGTLTYTIRIDNIGSGPSASPIRIEERMEPELTYVSLVSATLNGAAVTPTVTGAGTSSPVFSFAGGINAGSSLVLQFTALVGASTAPGEYCNAFTSYAGLLPLTTGSLACVQIGGGKIGDTIWRDWNGNGVQDPGEEGIAGVTVNLYESDGTTPKAVTTTDANGNYYFPALAAGTYVVKVNGGTTPAGYFQTGDPDQPGAACTSCDNQQAVALSENQQYLASDFGYKPTGSGTIGDKVFEDVGNDGVFNGSDAGIPNVTVWLYEDSNNNGVIDAGDALVATTTSNATGDYAFANLASGFNYLVKVDKTDPDIQTYFNTKYGANTPYQISTLEITASPNLTGSDLDNDFGFWRTLPASIGDQVFIDNNGNGLYDTGDTPLAGVAVTLYRDGVIVATATSGPDGTYLFDNLGPGNYQVVVDVTSAGVPAGYSASVSQYTQTLAAGENYLDADFPFTPLISKSVDKAYATTGDTLNFGVEVNYSGSDLLSNVNVRDFLPTGTSFSSAGQGGALATFSSAPGVPGEDAGSAGDGTVTVSAQADIADTWLDENSPSTNYGSATSLRIDSEATRPERTVIRFTLPTLPSDAVVGSATLKLTKLSGISIAISAHQADNTWLEAQATWINRLTGTAWDTPGGDYVVDAADPSVSSDAATGDRTWSVGHIVQNWLDGSPNDGFLLKATTEAGVNNVNAFASKDHATLASRPTLTITYTSTARPATSNTITVTPTVVAVGSPITVTMALTSSQAVTNLVPSALTVSGGAATCTGPSPASLDLTANVTGTVTWTCTPSGIGEYTFSATATNGTVSFLAATSNSVLASPNGENQYVSWGLGSNAAGSTGVKAANSFVYAFGGNDLQTFWAYSPANNNWTTFDPTDTPAGVTVNIGGALTNDGSRYIYALRGDTTKTFLRYDAQSNSWDDAGVADLPAAASNVVAGGALVHLNGFVYAFVGGDSLQFWRYQVSTNTWTQMASTPTNGTVNQGAALATDGTNVYALQGDGKKGFWRYNVAADTWTVLTPIPANVGKGGALRFANGAFYALIGNKKQTFYRYNIAANTWTTLAPTGVNVQEGGALAYDGTHLYAFMGKGNGFRRYDIATNTWSAMTNAPAAVGWGGALTFLATGNTTRTTLSAAPTLVKGGAGVKLTLTLTSNYALNGVGAGTLALTGTNGASASCGGATLRSADNSLDGTSGDSVTYEWTCTATAGANPGSLTFTATPPTAFNPATSNSVLVTPTLTYAAQVGASPPAVIKNTAYLNGVSLVDVPSNTTETATTASIGDYVWADLDGDGAQTGEYGLAGVRVYIDANGNGVFDTGEPSDLTDASGRYRLFGLAPGTHTVRTDPATYPAGFLPSTSVSLAVDLASGQQYDAADFGLQPPPPPGSVGSIGDTVWLDADNDGLRDPGEAGLAGIQMILERLIGGVWTQVASTTTDSDGQYLFGGLPAGDYRVRVDESASTVASPYDPAVTPSLAAAMVLTTAGGNPTATISLAAGQDYREADFGYNWGASIGDFVWYDTNANGAQDEAGIQGAPSGTLVLYYDSNGNGAVDPGELPLATFTTDTTGAYLFAGLPPGKYVVALSEQEIPSPASGRVNTMVNTVGEYLAVTLGANQAYRDADFGVAEAARIEGHVFHDRNNNGILEGDELPLAGVVVTLRDRSGNVVATTTTDADGEYVFIAAAGDYTITYDAATGGAPGYPASTTPVSIALSVEAGVEYPNNDFGRNYSGAIGDRVWNDADGNGIQDAGELGIPGVTVELYDSTGGTLLAVTVTDGNGNYGFAGLQDGTYVVKVLTSTLPAGFAQTYDNNGAQDDGTGQGLVSAGGSDLSVDFGYRNAAGFSVSGNVWNDNGVGGGTAGNGTKDGSEPDIAGVRVCLYQADGVTVVACTNTDGSGNYAFPGTPNGTYVIQVDPTTLPSTAFVQTGDPDGTKDHKTTVTVNGVDVTGQDFGYQASLGGISGTVVGTTAAPANGNGAADGGEGPQPGVIVLLTWGGPDGILGTADDTVSAATTDASGDYKFPNLEPGLYQITKINPAGFTSLADRDGGNPNSISLSLSVGQSRTGQDFEVQPTGGSLGDSVWLDVDRDGVQDIGEPGLANVGVALWSPGADGVIGGGDDRLIAVTTTDLNGNYLFTDLPAGGYYVKVDTGTLPAAGLTETAGNTGSTSALIPLLGGQSYLDADFGYVGPAGTAVIGNFVWSDANDDGLQDPGEPGIGRVTLRLVDENGVPVNDPSNPGSPWEVTTNADGSYYFVGVPAGKYKVEVVTPPVGYTLTAGPQSGTSPSVAITVIAGTIYDQADFGYFKADLHAVADRVWFDADRNGTQDPGEAGIAGVTVNLYADLDGDGRFTKEVIDGAVDRADCTGCFLGYDIQGGLVYSSGSPLTGVTLNGVAVIDGQLDLNGDGSITAADDGLVVDEPIIATAISDDQGDFAFTGLPDGRYVMEVADNHGQLAGYQGTTVDALAYRRAVEVAGADVSGVHFGYASLGPIGDTVFSDANGNGVQDPGELGIPGVSVGLYRDADGDNLFDPAVDLPVATTTTDASGKYAFDNLVAGVYFVSIDNTQAALAGYAPTTTDQQGASAASTEIGASLGAGLVSRLVFAGGLDLDGDGVVTGADDGFAHGVQVIDGRLNLNGDGAISAADAGWWNGIRVIAGELDLNGDGAITASDAGAVRITQPVFLNADFGYRNSALADIAGTVWNDTNRNAVLEGGEPRFQQVTLALLDGGGKVLATTISAADGSYRFADVPVGSYRVVVTDTAAVLNGFTLTSGLDQIPVTVGASDITGIDFGYVRQTGTARIGDTVWLDANGDGLAQPNEAGLSGVTVYLCGSSPCTSSNATATTTTDANGGYLFSGLPAGNYFVGVDATGIPANLDPTTFLTGTTGQIALSDGEAFLSADFGFKPAAGYAVLGDTVWYDVNGNGLQDSGEVGIGGVKIVILDQETGAVVTEVITGADGSWLAVIPEDATATSYVVFVDKTTLPGGVVTTPTNMGGGDTYIATVKAGDVRLNLDFGYTGGNPASIGDTVWLDANGNGARDAGEAGLSGVTLLLYSTGPDGVLGNADDKAVASTTTNATGAYVFSGLLPGEYYVRVGGLPAGLSATTDTGGTGAGSNASLGRTGEISLTAGQTYVLADFGYQPAAGTAVIGERVWSDADADGVQDAGEVGIAGVTAYLCAATADPCDADSAIRTTVTAADGSYLFSNVPATGTEDYKVSVVPPAGYGAAPTNNGGSTSYTLTDLAGGQSYLDNDWGFQPTNGGGTIGDTVYRSDVAGNPGIPDVTVALINCGAGNCSDGDESVVATATTGADGTYLFSGVPAGSYQVSVTDTGGVLSTLALTAKPASPTVTIACNGTCASNLDQDFGYASRPGSGTIGDFVWFDMDGDGLQDPGEPGISGVTLNLVRDGQVVATKTTDANGFYSFDGLAAGTFTVVVTDTNRVLSGLTASFTPIQPVTITCSSPCTQIDTVDFGYKPTVGGGVSTLGGTIWRDTIQPDGEQGTLQPGEPGLQGVRVELWLDDGDGLIEPGIDNLVRTTFTDANGNYNFLGLPPGTYIVRVPDDATPDVAGNTGTNGVLNGMTAIQGPSPTQDGNGHVNPYAVTLPVNTTDTSVDFAYRAPPTASYSLSGTVFEDSGAEGVLGANDGPSIDPVVPGATVQLFRVVDGQQLLVGTTTTNGDGFYAFTNLPPGDYVVKVNTTGTLVDGFEQTADPDQPASLCTVCDSQTTVTISDANLTGLDFGYWNGGVITTPISLSYFKATSDQGLVSFEWRTASEIANVGFRLYVLEGEEWVLWDEIPSSVVNSRETTVYTYGPIAPTGAAFILADVNVRGKERRHGPFLLDQVYGVERAEPDATNWSAIGQERENKQLKRQSDRKQKKAKKPGQGIEQHLDSEELEMRKNLQRQRGQPRSGAVDGPGWVERLAGLVAGFLISTAQAAPPVDQAQMLLEVQSAGLHRVTYEQLRDAGADLAGAKLDRLALRVDGQDVPRYVKGQDGKGKETRFFGPGGYIEFVGRPRFSLYGSTNIYTLSLDQGLVVADDNTNPPKGASAPAYYLETITEEPQLVYNPIVPGDDPWYAQDVLAWGRPASHSVSITVDHYVRTSPVPPELTVNLWGGSDFPSNPDHHAQLSLNGERVAEGRFDGFESHDLTASLAAGLLKDGVNSLTLTLPWDTGEEWDLVSLNRWSLTYPRAFVAREGRLTFTAAADTFKVSGLPAGPVQVYRQRPDGRLDRVTKVTRSGDTVGFKGQSGQAATYILSADTSLYSPRLTLPPTPEDITSGSAGYLIIAHPDFIAGSDGEADPLGVLKGLRAGHGVKVVDVEQIYARFGHYQTDPKAIKEYIAYAHANLGTEYVLLVGGDTYDYHGYVSPAVSFIPSLYAQTDELVRFAPVDPLYADVSGDGIPDLAIGRLPVRTRAELAIQVQKLVDYEYRNTGANPYDTRSVFAADRYDTGQRYSFKKDVEERMLPNLPEDWSAAGQVETIYLDDYAPTSKGRVAARAALQGAINAGVSLTSFVGHSDSWYWSFENLFNGDDAAKLTNAGRPTVVTQWGCWNTYYVDPFSESLAHKLLANPNGGAATVLGATTLTEARHERGLADLVYGRLFEPGTTMGAAVLAAKQAYAAEYPEHRDVILGWTILGDPAVVIAP